MRVRSDSFDDGGRISADHALAKHHPETHFTFAGNRSPHVAWDDLPEGTASVVVTVVDVDAPTVADDVNQEGRTVPKDLPRADFVHWILCDVDPERGQIVEAEFGTEVIPGGKDPGHEPHGRSGRNDYTSWFAGNDDLEGEWYGYDGPAPPWNDEREHRYVFTVFAVDVPELDVEGDLDHAAVQAAMEGHVLDSASITGTYTQNPDLL